MIRHHPAPDTLVEYAAGSLPPAQALCLSVHLGYCQQCQEKARQLKQVASNLMAKQAPVEVDASLFDRVMARIQTEAVTPEPKPVTEKSYPWPSIPKALRKLLPNGFDSLNWKRAMKNLEVAELDIDQDTKVSFHRMSTGGKVPAHTHRSDELTVVLQGGFSDRYGRYDEGDFIVRTGEHEHAPTVDQDGDCITLSVMEKPIKLTGRFTRLLNPFLR